MALATQETTLAQEIARRIQDRSAFVGVVGLGYVGLPLAVSFAKAGFQTVGFEIDRNRIRNLREGRSYVGDVASETLRLPEVRANFTATTRATRLGEPDVLIVCLPTPLNRARNPDLTILREAFGSIKTSLRRGQLIILSSTTYPGTTDELALPVLESSGLRVGADFFLAYSPERMDPGNGEFGVSNTPRVVGGVTPPCAALAKQLLEHVVARTHLVSNCRAAEMTKLLENTFRSVNIALVNEMAMICRKLGLDVWEVIEAASTKPFGFMRFEPGPGLGGHCIPIDPMYLSWKLRQLNFRTRFVDLAENVNRAMPDYIVGLVGAALNDRGKTLRGARILTLGLAYKRDIADARESPAIEVVQSLVSCGAVVRAHDPYVAPEQVSELPFENGDLGDDVLAGQDCLLILTDHSVYDWKRIFAQGRLIVDTRGVSLRVAPDSPAVVRL
jgi:UDP-N-acetyl-D-glucosamine dehydrogenase